MLWLKATALFCSQFCWEFRKSSLLWFISDPSWGWRIYFWDSGIASHSPNRCHSACSHSLFPSLSFLPSISLISLSLLWLQLTCQDPHVLPASHSLATAARVDFPHEALILQKTKSETADPLKCKAQSQPNIISTHSVGQNITSQLRFKWRARTLCSMGVESENAKLSSIFHGQH